MADRDLVVLRKAKELAKHTYRITSNSKKYPKKYRYSLVQEIQNDSMKINKFLREANRTDIREQKRERLESQTKVIGICDDLMMEIELSFEKRGCDRLRYKSSRRTIKLDKDNRREQMATHKPNEAAMKHFSRKAYSIRGDTDGERTHGE